MITRFRPDIKILVSILAFLAVILLDRTFNRPIAAGNSGPSALIVLDDFHDRHVNLGIIVGYGASRYSASFTSFEWGGRTFCTLPLSIYSVLVLAALLLTLSLWAAVGLLSPGKDRNDESLPDASAR